MHEETHRSALDRPPFCDLCGLHTDEPLGYCRGCQASLAAATQAELGVDPDADWHIARYRRLVALPPLPAPEAYMPRSFAAAYRVQRGRVAALRSLHRRRCLQAAPPAAITQAIREARRTAVLGFSRERSQSGSTGQSLDWWRYEVQHWRLVARPVIGVGEDTPAVDAPTRQEPPA